jgi:plasmid stability protein
MEKIVLRNLPPEIQRSIKRKALNEDLSREDAVLEILREAEIQRQADREIAIIDAKFGKESEGV